MSFYVRTRGRCQAIEPNPVLPGSHRSSGVKMGTAAKMGGARVSSRDGDFCSLSPKESHGPCNGTGLLQFLPAGGDWRALC